MLRFGAFRRVHTRPARAPVGTRGARVLPLEKIGAWKCQPFTLSATDLTVAARLIEASLIPETEQNDGRILAQTSLAGIPLVATSDKHLLDVDEDALLLAFNEADLPPVHPKRLLKALR